ncbi:MAG: tetratricopeptide repeat protein [Phycisphaerae bacterium]|nr:tetratricopeptide repeat protein [Phycisphaerales bacterium]
MKQKASTYLIMAVSVIWLTSCSEKTEFVSSQSQSNWKSADPAALAGAEPEETPDIMPQTHYAAGRLFEKQGAVVRAAKQYKKALLRDPNHVPSISRLGMIYAKQGHYPQAEEYLQKAVELWPNSPQARNNLGFCYVMQERWYDAEAEFRNTLKLDPSFIRARVNLAMALSKLNRFDEALGEFKLAVPEPEAYYNLGLLYRSAQRYEEAAGAFATALKRKPEMTLAKQQLDRMKLQLERTREYPVDAPAPQSTEFAASNNSKQQWQQNNSSNVRTNQSYAMQPVESQSVATSEQNAQTASWSNASTASSTNTQPVEAAPAQEWQNSNTQYSSTQYANEPVASSPAILPMQPVEDQASQSVTQHDDTDPVFVQDTASNTEDQTASNATDQQNQQNQQDWSNNSAVETYETYPVASATEQAEEDSQEADNVEVASNEPVDSVEQEQTQTEDSQTEPVQWDQSHFVGSQPSTGQQNQPVDEIEEVQPVFVAGQNQSNQPSQTPTQLKPTPRPVQTQNVATTQPVFETHPVVDQTQPATSNQTQKSDALVLEATPVEETYAPSRKSGQPYERVQTQQQSASSMTPAQPQDNASMTADLSEIESVEPVEPGTTEAPKKARTATHKSNADQVEVRPMGKVGMAPVAPAPQPQTQAMPASNVTNAPAPQKAIEPAVLEMKPIEDAGDDDSDDSDSANIEEDIEVVEMEAVEN